MSQSIFRAMYGVNPIHRQMPQETKEKRAVKVLGGMKVHNSHIKRVQIGEDLIDVPKIEYMQLLEGQVRELRSQLRAAESKLIRLEHAQQKMLGTFATFRSELAGKVIMR
jgi:hypothetical protein